MKEMIEKFKALVAPHVAEAAQARVTSSMTAEEVLAVINEEIMVYLEKFLSMSAQVMTFEGEKGTAFHNHMYDLLKELNPAPQAAVNPVYAQFQAETGKAINVDFICWHLAR